jgi:hypothetical protein
MLKKIITNPMKSRNYIAGITALFLICSSLFIYTVHIRKPWFGELSNDKGGHQWLTASTLKFSQYWYNEGPLNLRFGLIENPPSKEFPTLLSRMPYASYPPGTIVPVYLLSKIIGHEPAPSIVMGLNLAQHYIITILLSFFVFFILIRWGSPVLPAVCFSFIPALIYQLLPGVLYWHQNVFWADQAIILPFVLLIILEFLRDHKPQKRGVIQTIQSTIIFFGILTDWFCLFIVFVIFLKRIITESGHGRSLITNILVLGLPVIAAFGLFSLQIKELQLWDGLVKKFWERTGIEGVGKGEKQDFFRIFWLTHIPFAYGKAAVYLIFISIVSWSMLLAKLTYENIKRINPARELSDIVHLMTIALIPCLLQVNILNNHSSVHNFSAFKFAVPLALIPLVILPAFIYLFLVKKRSGKVAGEKGWLFLSLLMLIVSIVYILPQHLRYKKIFPEPFPFYREFGGFIAKNTDETDIVFSTQGSIGANPPQFLYFSKKRVYQVMNAVQIYFLVKDLPGPYNICILNNGNPEMDEDIKKLSSMAFDVRKDPSGLTLYKIRGK